MFKVLGANRQSLYHPGLMIWGAALVAIYRLRLFSCVLAPCGFPNVYCDQGQHSIALVLAYLICVVLRSILGCHVVHMTELSVPETRHFLNDNLRALADERLK